MDALTVLHINMQKCMILSTFGGQPVFYARAFFFLLFYRTTPSTGVSVTSVLC